MRGWMLGLFVWYGVALVSGLVAWGLAIFGEWTYVMLIFPIVNGVAIGICVSQLVILWRQRRERELIGRLPVKVHVIDRDEERQVVAVERRNGEVVTVEVPGDYDPRDDQGEAVMRQVMPEIFDEGL